MNNPTQGPPAQEGMLLSSLVEFWSLIEPLLMAAQAKNICEIGLGKGKFTTALVQYCKTNSGHYVGIDPQADKASLLWDEAAPAELVQRSSLRALLELASQDVYFIDGDHNYHTVRNELQMILGCPDRWPLVILHDVCWPWGRRDQYCAPESIPDEARHSNSNSLGVIPGRNELGEEGFSGQSSDYSYATASHESGPRNGVLTAAEDFLKEPSGQECRLLIVPVVFGLGILYSPRRVSEQVRENLSRLESAVVTLRPLLEVMERNRVNLFLAYLSQMKNLEGAHREYRKLHDAYDQLAAHARALQGKYEELRAHTDSIETAYKKLRQ